MAGALLGNLSPLLQNEFATLYGMKSEAQKLSATLDLINAVLEDAEHKQLNNRSIKAWLQQLKDAMYVLDDILDECSIESHRFSGLPSFYPKNILFRRKICKKLREITLRLDQIAEMKDKFLLQVGVTIKEISIEVAEWRQTISINAEPIVYGREGDKEKIVKFLVNQVRDYDLVSIYPIVGLGGVGKTTISQLVYNDNRVSNHFDTKFWVCVSEVFSVKRIVCSIIESISGSKCYDSNLDVMQKKVREMLQGKRFLLVLDDVWKRNQELKFGLDHSNWNMLKSVISCGSKGACILLSTRDSEVAEITGTCQAHYLSGLSEDECWLLFKQYAFGLDKEERPELVTIGKEIVKKCGGLPLAAQTLGGLMRSRSEEKEWLEIKNSELWSLPDENFIFPALKLSYLYLTPTLKQCFSFCAIFPKDSEIMKDELIYLWMANGFISSRKNLKAEDVGNMVWNELFQKSFFQDIKLVDNSEDISFKMHDIVHDLAQYVTGPECMILENTETDLSTSTHHINIDYSSLQSINECTFKKVESLRTLYGVNISDWSKFDLSHFLKCSSLRVLRIDCAMLCSLESLIHLRHLELHGVSPIFPIFDSIHTLRKLEVLIIKSLRGNYTLPKQLSRLQNLRHLVIDHWNGIIGLFPNIGKLSCLRTLSVFIVSREVGCSLAELCDLKLEGRLIIRRLENVGSLSEARKANLMAKNDLQELRLSWVPELGSSDGPCPEQVLEALKPHSNLKRLRIDTNKGLCAPSWISALCSLVSLQLWHCTNWVQLSHLSKLPYLKEITLYAMSNLRYMDDDECCHGVEMRAFPSLEKLTLVKLPSIERLLKVERGEIFPRLFELTIKDCPTLVLPHLSSIKELFVVGCNNKLLSQISSFNGLTSLHLERNENLTSLPDGMLRNLSSLQNLTISDFRQLKELPELVCEGMRFLRMIDIVKCEALRSLPEGIQHLSSIELLTIHGCSKLREWMKERLGGDWSKIQYLSKLRIRLQNGERIYISGE